jgi:hypothetical protein
MSKKEVGPQCTPRDSGLTNSIAIRKRVAYFPYALWKTKLGFRRSTSTMAISVAKNAFPIIDNKWVPPKEVKCFGR